MGITVLLVGVRMLIAEIVPAFRGIALKVVPDAVPALDCPVVFDFAPDGCHRLVSFQPRSLSSS